MCCNTQMVIAVGWNWFLWLQRHCLCLKCVIYDIWCHMFTYIMYDGIYLVANACSCLHCYMCILNFVTHMLHFLQHRRWCLWYLSALIFTLLDLPSCIDVVYRYHILAVLTPLWKEIWDSWNIFFFSLAPSGATWRRRPEWALVLTRCQTTASH